MPPSVAFVMPLLPGKTETERAALASMHSGERRAATDASRRRHGITRAAAWLQSTPMGGLVVVYLEAEDLGAAFGGIATSTDPFDVWFREHSKDVHGIDLAEGFPPPEQLLGHPESGAHQRPLAARVHAIRGGRASGCDSGGRDGTRLGRRPGT